MDTPRPFHCDRCGIEATPRAQGGWPLGWGWAEIAVCTQSTSNGAPYGSPYLAVAPKRTLCPSCTAYVQMAVGRLD